MEPASWKTKSPGGNYMITLTMRHTHKQHNMQTTDHTNNTRRKFSKRTSSNITYKQQSTRMTDTGGNSANARTTQHNIHITKHTSNTGRIFNKHKSNVTYKQQNSCATENANNRTHKHRAHDTNNKIQEQQETRKRQKSQAHKAQTTKHTSNIGGNSANTTWWNI